jgi:outer membrane protein assembly factor BamB
MRAIIVFLSASAGALIIVLWLAGTNSAAVAMRVPAGRELRSEIPQAAAPGRVNPGTLIAGPGKPSGEPGDWPQFRGADRTNVAANMGRLARSWPEGGPRVLWSLDVGEGHAGAAVHRGRIYLMDYDREKKEDALRCLSLADASEIWRYTYSVDLKRNHGMSRTVPAVTDNVVVAIGPRCHVHCLGADDGNLLWKVDLVKDNGAVVPPWYAGQCPFISGNSVVLAPGGDPLMMAVELATGRVLWKTPNPGGWGMTHSSIVSADYKGLRQFVYCSTEGALAVGAGDGRILWTKPDWKITLANVPSPVVAGPGMIFFSGGYNSGCMMLQIEGNLPDVAVREIFRLKHTVFGSDQQTPVFYDGCIYGVIPNGEMTCLDLAGNRLWSSGDTARFGLGPYIIADGLIFALNDQDGTLHMAEASPAGFKELSKAKVLDGHDCWGPMAIAGRKLILRSSTRMVCLELPGE